MSTASGRANIKNRFQILLCTFSVVVIACCQLSSKILRDGSQARERGKISVTTNLVLLPVNVTDSNGTFISGLRRENFRVYEDGQLQNVTLFVEEDTPVTVGLLVDHSYSMGPKLSGVVVAVTAFASSGNPADEMFIVDFSDNVSVQTFHGKPFTGDPKALQSAVLAVSASGQTALYDAVVEGLKHLELGTREKRALVIVSDGGDNASRHKYSDVLRLAREAHAVIYSIGLVGSTTEEENPRALERLCRETGGIAFLPHAGQNITNIAKAIARDLREQYTLGYTPPTKPNVTSFRKIAIKVDAPGLGKVHVRTRPGYVPPSGNALQSQTSGSL